MLSCLVPRFGPESNIMPATTSSAAAAAAFFPSLLGFKENEHTSYLKKCFQCNEIFHGYQALKEHIDTVHPLHKDELHHGEQQRSASASSLASPPLAAHHHNHLPSPHHHHQHQHHHQPYLHHSQPPSHHNQYQQQQASPHSTSSAQSSHHHHLLSTHLNSLHHLHPNGGVVLGGGAGGGGGGRGGAASVSSSSSTQHDESHVGIGGRGCSISPSIPDVVGGGSISQGIGGPHACAQCSATFPTFSQLEKHELLHSPNVSVSCKICHKSFANVYRLQRHMISHDESALLRKFKCTDCDKAFKFKHHLKEHVRIHSGEKPFGCGNCGKRFSHSGSYSSHMTSKKCISMGLKLTNGSSRSASKSEKSPRGYGSPISNNNNNLATSPNHNAFMQKYGNYDAMNAAFLASFQNPFYGMGAMDPRAAAMNPFNFQRLLNLTNASHGMDLLGAGVNVVRPPLHIKTPSLHSDPEDMIEEVTDDMGEDMDADISDEHEPSKLVMDLKDDDQTDVERRSPSPYQANHSTYNSIQSRSMSEERPLESPVSVKMEHPKLVEPPTASPYDEDIKTERPQTPQADDLTCSKCSQKFNHHTELVQHEKVLCGMFHSQESIKQAYNMQSGSEDEAEETHKGTSDAERKVRVRTAISEEQQIRLKEHYAINARPNREEFRTIAQRLSLDARVVQVWFQNNRSRERKMNSMGYLKSSQSFDVASQPKTQSVLSNSVARSQTPVDDQPLDLSIKKDSIHRTPSNSPTFDMSTAHSENGTANHNNNNNDSHPTNEVMNLSRKSGSEGSSPTIPMPYTQQLPLHPQHPARSMPHNFYGASMSRAVSAQDYFSRQTPSPNEAVARFMPFPQLSSSSLGLVPMDRLLQMATPEVARSNPLMHFKSAAESLSPGSEKRSSWKGGDESRSSHEDEMVPHQQHHKRSKQSQQQQQQLASAEPEIEGQFVCEQCDKAFSKQSSLARHKYEHSGQRPYKCVDCPKAFKHKHHLTEHKRLHSGEKPFQCSKCLKRFSHSGSYSQHMNHRYSYCKPYRD